MKVHKYKYMIEFLPSSKLHGKSFCLGRFVVGFWNWPTFGYYWGMLKFGFIDIGLLRRTNG